MVSIGGNDWLGFGAVFSGITQGTENCGARPLIGKERQKAYEECVKRTLELQSQQIAIASQNQPAIKSDTNNSEKTNKNIIIAIIVSAIVILGIVIVVKGTK